jgi:hypothetical protein
LAKRLLTYIPHFGKVARKKPNFTLRRSIDYHQCKV